MWKNRIRISKVNVYQYEKRNEKASFDSFLLCEIIRLLWDGFPALHLCPIQSPFMTQLLGKMEIFVLNSHASGTSSFTTYKALLQVEEYE